MKFNRFFLTLVLGGGLLLSSAFAVHGFISLQQERGKRDIMIDKVHEPHWTIHYSYGDDCPAEERNNDAALTAAVTEALQMWLQPLRAYSKHPLVDDFRYKLSADWDAADLGITFHCELRRSSAPVFVDRSPGIDLHHGTRVEQAGFMSILVHEIGHIFGLADTYVLIKDRGKPGFSKGGLDSTKGTQPAALMAGRSIHRDGRPVLGKDDKNGIIWLYKVSYEGLSIRDCFFSDYELEHAPLGCRPKHPLIFELKNGVEIRSVWMLEEDENLDVNAQDDDGMTALHYAVIDEFEDVVKELIKRDDIKPYLRNKQGQSPLQLAVELKHDDLAQRIAAHPKAMPVDARGKTAITWGRLKQGD